MQDQTIVARSSMNEATWQLPARPIFRLDKKFAPCIPLVDYAFFDRPEPAMHGCDVGQGICGFAAEVAANANRNSFQRIDRTETVFVSHVVADEDGAAAAERMSMHHLADRRTFVVFGRRKLEHHFTGNQAKVFLDIRQ
jgi:hypothetical protein